MLSKSRISALWRSLRLHAGARDVAFSSRIILFLLKAWTNSGGRLSRDIRIRVSGGYVFLSADTLKIDLDTFAEIYLLRVYPPPEEGAVVIDIGAHKGYYATWALANGAVAVASYEPQSANFAALERAWRSRKPCTMWTINRAAVGSIVGLVSLYVSDESWAHSIYPSMGRFRAAEEVRMTTLEFAINDCQSRWGHCRVLLKVDVEGAAFDVLGHAQPDELRPVYQICFDHEPGSPYDVDELLSRLAVAGFDLVTVDRDQEFRLARSE